MDYAKGKNNMARSSRSIDFTRGIKTRVGNDIRLYEIFDGRYINGAWYDTSDDVWYPVQWGIDGRISPDSRDDLDLINETKKKEDT